MFRFAALEADGSRVEATVTVYVDLGYRNAPIGGYARHRTLSVYAYQGLYMVMSQLGLYVTFTREFDNRLALEKGADRARETFLNFVFSERYRISRRVLLTAYDPNTIYFSVFRLRRLITVSV